MTRGTITEAFGGETRTFLLDMGGWELFQSTHDIGPLYLELSFRGMQATPAHIKGLVKYGLIGGGMAEAEAIKLVDTVIKAGFLLRYYQLAHNILLAFIGPDDEEDEPLGKPEPQNGVDINTGQKANSPSEE